MYNALVWLRLYDDFLQKSPRATLPTGSASPREATGSSRSPRRGRRPQQRCTASSFPGDGSVDPVRGALAPNPLGPPRGTASSRAPPPTESRAQEGAWPGWGGGGRHGPSCGGARPSFTSARRSISPCNAAARRRRQAARARSARALLGVGVAWPLEREERRKGWWRG
jgi:hypothetical protein